MAPKSNDRAAKAAALRAEQEKRERQRRIATILGVVLAMVLIVGGAVWIGLAKQSHDNKVLEKGVAAASGKYGVVIGPDSAAHHVVIYEDFLCPICGALEAGSHEKLTELADAGKVQVEYRPFDLLSRNVGADYPIRAAGAFSIVLEKSGPTVAKAFHDLLYAHQPSEEGPYLSDADLVKYAVEAGAKEAQVKGPIESGAGKAWVTAASQEAFATGLTGTPTILVDGKLLDSTAAEGLLAAVE